VGAAAQSFELVVGFVEIRRLVEPSITTNQHLVGADY
jgi:hypothetical protein